MIMKQIMFHIKDFFLQGNNKDIYFEKANARTLKKRS